MSASPHQPDEPAGPPAFERFYRATVAPLRRHLARMLGNPDDAAEVAHDAYLRVKPFVEENRAENPEALLYTTARRHALNQLKRRQVAPFAPGELQPDLTPANQPGVAQQVMARQELAQLEAAIAQLPEGCRAVLLLRKVELLSHQEIADRLGIAVSTVEKQHARALRLLRAALAPTGTAAPAARTESRP